MGNLTVPFSNDYSYSFDPSDSEITIKKADGTTLGSVVISSETGVKVAVNSSEEKEIIFYDNPAMGSDPYEFEVLIVSDLEFGIRELEIAGVSRARWIIGIDDDLTVSKAGITATLDDSSHPVSLQHTTGKIILKVKK